jgi:FMN phosphatase YigB (HAD superfamily)
MTVISSTDPSALIARKSVLSVSFALFGTLLQRRCFGLDGLFERTLQLAPVPERLKQMPDSFVQHRNLAQNRLRIGREGGGKVSLVSGVSIETIYDNFAVRALNLPVSIRPDLIEAELAAEKDLAVLNPTALALIEQARAAGKKIGVVAESHWSPDQIRAILKAAAPRLSFDFIYSSASPEVLESLSLFKSYLAGEGLKPAQAVHIGVDLDTVVQPVKGLAVGFLPAGADPREGEDQREIVAAKLLASFDRGFSWRLDGGFRLLRDAALAEIRPRTPHLQVAASVIGPVMAGFQRHIEHRVAELSTPGRKVRLLFLARDGYLPLRFWNAAGGSEADYVEINRRIAMVAGSGAGGGTETVQGLLGTMDFVKPQSIEDFFKITLNKKTRDFFERYPNRLCPGADFAANMTRLLGKKQLDKVSDGLRASLMNYLEIKLGSLDGVTDIILADIGYTGNIQRGLRRVLDVEGRAIALHGLYLMPHGEAFIDLPGEDTVSGYFDDTVMTPQVKRAVMRDAPLIEEFCCAPVGSAKGYDNAGKEIREPEVRLPEEISFCLEMQDEAIRWFDAYRAQVKRFGFDPMADFATYRAWSAAILARFVMMPTPLECQTFGPLLHDVSLGSRGLIATITTADIRNLMGTLPMPSVCSIHHPPVWLGGSLAAHNAASGLAYAMTGFGLPTDDMLRDVEIGEGDAVLVKDERVIQLPMSRTLTPFGDIRLRLPVLNKDGECVIAVRLRPPMQTGIIRSIMLQGGDDIVQATTTRYGEVLPLEKIEAANASLDGKFFRALNEDGLLLINVPAFRMPISVVTLLLTPLFDD